MSQATMSQPADAPSKGRWWWTLARAEAACESCGTELAEGQKIAYRFPGKVYCIGCARKSSVDHLCEPSRKLQRRERALERHSAKALELRKALLQSQDGGKEVPVAVKPL